MVSTVAPVTGFQWNPVSASGLHIPVLGSGYRHQPMPFTVDQPVATSAHITDLIITQAEFESLIRPGSSCVCLFLVGKNYSKFFQISRTT
jgi:hypothetical protein